MNLKIEQKVIKGYTYRVETPAGFQYGDNYDMIIENIHHTLDAGCSEEKVGEWFCVQIGDQYYPLKDINEIGKIVEFKKE